MPPRQPTGPNRNLRRRPAPVMPGGWMWPVLLLAFVIMLFLVNTDGSAIPTSDFIDQLKKGNVTDIVIQGEDRVIGKITDPERLPEKIRDKLRKDHQVTTIVPGISKENNEVMKILIEKNIK